MARRSIAKSTLDKQEPISPNFPNRVIALMLLDTTWRVALPILILTIGGHRLDVHYQHTFPVFMIVGFFVSFVVSAYLVYRQLVTVFPDQFGKNRIKEDKTKADK